MKAKASPQGPRGPEALAGGSLARLVFATIAGRQGPRQSAQRAALWPVLAVVMPEHFGHDCPRPVGADTRSFRLLANDHRGRLGLRSRGDDDAP